LTENKKSKGTCGEARGRRGLAMMAGHKRGKFLSRRRSLNPASESKQTDSAPIRASAPLVEQYYVAVDRQLKSGYGTYEAAEKAAREIKKGIHTHKLRSLTQRSGAIPPSNNRQFRLQRRNRYNVTNCATVSFGNPLAQYIYIRCLS
jgi:hypothetical protein